MQPFRFAVQLNCAFATVNCALSRADRRFTGNLLGKSPRLDSCIERMQGAKQYRFEV
jgi:hypothetical protein